MLVLVTRPIEQARRTARELERRGHRAILDPVLEIRSVPDPAVDLAGVGAVAVTSAHAAPALAGLPEGLPVYAVGRATARAAEAALGRAVTVGEGDGRALGCLVAETLPPAAGAVLHLAGRETSPGLAEALAAAGHGYRRCVVYEAVPTTDLAPAAAAALRGGEAEAVLFHSPRSARLWAGKVRAAGLAESLGRARAVCLSPAVAQGLAGLGFGEIRVAARPAEADLLRCLEAVP